MKISVLLSKAKIFLPILLLLPGIAYADDSWQPGPWIALLEGNLDDVATIMQCFAIAGGVTLLAAGLYGFQKAGQARTMMSSGMSFNGPMFKFFCGIVLLSMATWADFLANGIFGPNSSEANPFINSNDPLEELYEPVMMLVRLVGIGIFMKMVFALSRIGGQNTPPGSAGKAMVLGGTGVALMHIQTILALTMSFFGYTSPF